MKAIEIKDNLMFLKGKYLSSLRRSLMDLQCFASPSPFKNCIAKIAINMYPAHGPWGGSSVFVHQVVKELRRNGFRVAFHLDRDIDAILIIDPREDLLNKSFGIEEIRSFKKENTHVKVIHRVNECDKRKNSAFMDQLLQEANLLADYTVFISEWLRDYFAQKWFDINRPHRVVYNGADPEVFHPIGEKQFAGEEVFRLVTHHWSANWMKGFGIYKEIDSLISRGKLKDLELWVIGQWPEEIVWQSAITFPPASGKELAGLLQECHAYVTASLWEPCGMHHVEGAQCGLPLLYHEDGGGIVEAGLKYGIGFREDSLVEAIDEIRANYPEMSQRVLHSKPDGNRMVAEYVRTVQELLAINK